MSDIESKEDLIEAVESLQDKYQQLDDEAVRELPEFPTADDVREQTREVTADQLEHLFGDHADCESEGCEHFREQATKTFADRLGIDLGDGEEGGETEGAEADDAPEEPEGEETEESEDTDESDESDHWADGW